MTISQSSDPSIHSPSQEKLLSRRSICDRWDVSIDFIRKLEGTGELNPIKLSPRCLRYRLSEIMNIENTK